MKSTKKIWFFALFLVLFLPITACGGQTVSSTFAIPVDMIMGFPFDAA